VSAKVVYNPPIPHECSYALDGTLRAGAISRCECGRYYRLVDRPAGDVWMLMDFFEILCARLTGRIPIDEREVRDDVRRADRQGR
jgi:hypothetical protein